MSAPRRRPGTIHQEVPETDECVLLEPESGRVLALNPTALAVWELLDGAREAAELAKVLHEATGVALDRAEADVRALLDQLAQEGFLAVEACPDSTP